MRATALPVLLALVLPGTICLAAAKEEERARPELRQFRSPYVKVSRFRFSTVTTLWTREDHPVSSPIRPRINMDLTNRSDRAIWLEARLAPPPPGEEAWALVFLEPDAGFEFESTQDSIVAEADYGIDLTVFADSSRLDTLERGRTRLRFDRREARQLEKRLELERCQHAVENGIVELPTTIEHVLVKENKGLLASLSGRAGRSGPLFVGLDGIRHATSKREIAIPAERLRRASLRRPDPSASWFWVVLEYDGGGATQELLICFAAFPLQAPEMEACQLLRMRATLEALIARAAPRGE